MSNQSYMVETLHDADEQSEKDGWDQPPILFVMQTHVLDPSTSLLEIKTCPGWLQTVEVTDTIQESIRMMSTIMFQVPSAIKRAAFPPETFHGLMLRTETWVLHVDNNTSTPGQLAAAQKASMDHTIDQHPDRIESRFIFMVTVNGDIAALSHKRNGEVEVFEPEGENVVSLSGEVPRLLQQLVKEIVR